MICPSPQGESNKALKVSGTGLYEVLKWTFNPKAKNPAYASNKTGGYMYRVAGIKDGSGSCEGKYVPSQPIMATVDVGTAVTLDAYLTATVFYAIPAIVDSLKIDVDLNTGEFVSWTMDFSTVGAWTNPASGLMAKAPEGEEASPEDGAPLADTATAPTVDATAGGGLSPVQLLLTTAIGTGVYT